MEGEEEGMDLSWRWRWISCIVASKVANLPQHFFPPVTEIFSRFCSGWFFFLNLVSSPETDWFFKDVAGDSPRLWIKCRQAAARHLLVGISSYLRRVENLKEPR